MGVKWEHARSKSDAPPVDKSCKTVDKSFQLWTNCSLVRVFVDFVVFALPPYMGGSSSFYPNIENPESRYLFYSILFKIFPQSLLMGFENSSRIYACMDALLPQMCGNWPR